MFEALRGLRDAVESSPGATDDATLVQQCVEGVLEKSRRIDRLLLICETTPAALRSAGPVRQRTQQCQRIATLLQEHEQVGRELQEMQAQALAQRRACRNYIQSRTEGILNLVVPDADTEGTE
jgi:hypothetical protein